MSDGILKYFAAKKKGIDGNAAKRRKIASSSSSAEDLPSPVISVENEQQKVNNEVEGHEAVFVLVDSQNSFTPESTAPVNSSLYQPPSAPKRKRPPYAISRFALDCEGSQPPTQRVFKRAVRKSLEMTFMKCADKSPESISSELDTDSSASDVEKAVHSCATPPPKMISPLPLSPTVARIPTQSKMSVDELRQKLLKCGKLSEVKKTLAELAASRSKVAAQPTASDANKTSIAKPISLVELAKTTPEKQLLAPAYQRFHSIATEAPPTLSLPYKYKVIEEVFRCSDTIVSMFHNRQETCTFAKMKSAMQQMSKRSFDAKHLAQILTVYPLAYELHYDKMIVSKSKPASYELVISFANLDELMNSPGKCLDSPGKTLWGKISAARMLRRRNKFHSNLLKLVHDQHELFLSTVISTPIDKKDLKRWHPKFPLDNVADIPEATLPECPTIERITTAEEAFEKVKQHYGLKINTRGRILGGSQSQTVSKADLSTSDGIQNVSERVNSVLNGVPQSLIDKIRAKEACKMIGAMKRTPEEEKRILILSRLPKFVNILRMFFIAEKKPAMSLADVTKHLSRSCDSVLGECDLEAHIRTMAEVMPDWINLNTIKGRGVFIKLDKNRDINEVSAAFEEVYFKEKA